VRLIELTPFEVPKRLVNYEIQEMLKQADVIISALPAKYSRI